METINHLMWKVLDYYHPPSVKMIRAFVIKTAVSGEAMITQHVEPSLTS